jgi:predicted secreted protein
MLLKKIVFSLSLILLVCVSGIWAGDTASFVDLGFSPDGRTYMFGQYGVLSPALKPWAELYIVNVAANDFVIDGKITYTYDNPIRAGQDGSGIFYRLLTNNSGLANRYNINYQNQGQPLYISLNTNPSEHGETIEFRDFSSGKRYCANLISSTQGGGTNTKSSFYINLECTAENGYFRTYTVGSPHIVRSQVLSYNINKVLINGDSLIFVIEMKRVGEGGNDVRYMVEALRL